MKLLVLQHAKDEALGSMKQWFVDKDATITTIRLDLCQALPKQHKYDWLIIMGGPMSVYEEERYPWLKIEKDFIREAIKLNKRILGICLGGQLIASALGAKVYANPEQEIGWFPIIKTNEIAPWLPDQTTLLCWHGDCFELPDNAINFAQSQATTNQGFCIGDRVWGLQFHIEAQESTAQTFFKVCGSKLPEGRYVQSLNSLNTKEHLYTSKSIVYKLLDFIHSH